MNASFSAETKQELLEGGIPKKACCRRALRAGLLYGALRQKGGWQLRTGHSEVAAFACTLLQDKKHPLPPTVWDRMGTPEYVLTVQSADQDRLLAALSDGTPLSGAVETCPGCGAQFLRGLFLVCSHLTAPSSGYHLELSLPEETAADGRLTALSVLLADRGCPPKTVRRASAWGLYYKSSGTMEDLLIQIGAPRAAFGVMNAKIEREIRNQENRATNCVTTNIRKTVAAARRQVAAVEQLEASGRLTALSDELQETARLRREHPDATLSELASLHNPPITKSGLTHRLAKLTDAAGEELGTH